MSYLNKFFNLFKREKLLSLTKNYFSNNVFVIKRSELRKFMPMFLIGSLVLFNFIMLRQLKKAIVLSTLGAAAIPDIKLWMVFPASFISMMIYSKLSNYFDGKQMFLIFLSAFTLFFGAYAFIFYDSSNIFIVYLFYTLAELWNTVIFGTCMWAFFNDVCTVDEAGRFYAIISGAQIGSFIASGMAHWLVDTFKETYIQVSMIMLFFCSLFIILIINGLDSVFVNIRKEKKLKNEDKQGWLGGINIVLRSRYLLAILFITLSYNFTIVVTEYIWDAHVKATYLTKAAIFIFTANVSFWTTAIASLVAIFLTSGLMRYVGIVTALGLYPIVFGLATTFYFFFMFTPVGGAIQWAVSKIAKYALSDPAKQVLFIPCSSEERYKGKALIDILGARGGKAFGSLFTKLALPIGSSIESVVYFSYPILIIITILWTISAVQVGLMFNKRKELK